LPSLLLVLRIIHATADDGRVVLRLVGQVRGRWVDELRSLSTEILRTPASQLELDLTEVSYLDADGILLLRDLSFRQVVVSHCSLFVAQQLGASGRTS